MIWFGAADGDEPYDGEFRRDELWEADVLRRGASARLQEWALRHPDRRVHLTERPIMTTDEAEIEARIAAARQEGDRAARRDIYEAIMQPGAKDTARRSGFTGHDGAVWATGYVAAKLECSRIAIADDEEWHRLAQARAEGGAS